MVWGVCLYAVRVVELLVQLLALQPDAYVEIAAGGPQPGLLLVWAVTVWASWVLRAGWEMERVHASYHYYYYYYYYYYCCCCYYYYHYYTRRARGGQHGRGGARSGGTN